MLWENYLEVTTRYVEIWKIVIEGGYQLFTAKPGRLHGGESTYICSGSSIIQYFYYWLALWNMDDAYKICRCLKLGEALSTVGAGLE